MTALLRRLVERELLNRNARPDHDKDAVMAIVGPGSAEPDDPSERHDEALDEAFRG